MNLNFEKLYKQKIEKQFLSSLSKMIEDSKKDIITQLSTISSDKYDAYWHSRILPFINDYAEDLKNKISSEWQGTMEDLISEMTKSYEKNIGSKISKVGVMTFGISPEQVLAISQLSAELVKNIPDLLRQEVTKQLQLSALSGDTIHDVAKKLTGTMEGYPGVFKKVETRAKTIARTEIMRVQSNITWIQIQELAQKFPHIQKIWRHSHGLDFRPSHLALDGTKIQWDEPFIIDGIPIMYPRDPNAPPDLTINCRCYFDVEIPDEDIERYLSGEIE